MKHTFFANPKTLKRIYISFVNRLSINEVKTYTYIDKEIMDLIDTSKNLEKEVHDQKQN